MIESCRVCGAELPANVLAGHCPHCLLQVSLESFRPTDPDREFQEPLPRTFGDYELLAEVARGGMGVVYRARQRSLRRQVALKMILSGPFASRAALERFRAEAHVAASLRHPAIVAIHEAGVAEGQPYFTMDFIEGRNLADLVHDGPLPPKRAARYIEQIARGIAYAHEHGVLHRDLKPANVLVDESDQVHITDFGLAKQVSGSQLASRNPSLTLTGQALGSPYYMAPEQADPQSGTIGVAADVYSIGAMLYHLLTGRPPFAAGSVAETLHQVVQNEPARLRVLDPSLPRDIETVCLKCLEKDPARRYRSANDVADELARFLRGDPVLTRAITQVERVWRWCVRDPTIAGLGALAALLPVAVLLALVVLATSNVRIREERNQKDRALQQRATALEAARKSEQQAREELFQALRNEARARRFSRQMGQRSESLRAVADAAAVRRDESLRDEATAALALADIQRGPSWPDKYPLETLAMVLDDPYEKCARLLKGGGISIRRVSDDAKIRKLDNGSTGYEWNGRSRLLFSPDGNFFAQMDYTNRFRVWRLAAGQLMLSYQSGLPLTAAFSVDSRSAVVATVDTLARFDVTTGQLMNQWALPTPACSVAFNPDSRRLAVGYFDSDTVSIYDAERGSQIAALKVGPGFQEIVAWHPDGRHLAAAGSDPRIQIWDVETTTRVATLEGHGQQVAALTFHPGGGLLASSSWDGGVRLWDPIAARQVMEIPFGPDIRFSQDGRWLGFTVSKQVQLWAVTPNEEYSTLGQGSAYGGDVSPDGRFLALGMEDGVRVWDLRQRREVAFRALDQTPSAFFVSNGRALMTCSFKYGLQCWPLEVAETSTGLKMSLGQPQPIPLPWAPQEAARDRDGRTIGVISEAAGEALVLDLDSQNRGRRLSHYRGNSLAVSPDGRWVATASWHSTLVRLWDSSGNCVYEWPLGGQNEVTFRPNSKELVISSPGQFGFWDLDTLKPRLTLSHDVFYPGHPAFSFDQKMMAMEISPGIIHLKEVATGRTVAKLENPFRERSTWMAFSSDATQLIVASRYAKTIRVWDLARIRAGLRSLGLDWQWPEFHVTTRDSIENGAPSLMKSENAVWHAGSENGFSLMPPQ